MFAILLRRLGLLPGLALFFLAAAHPARASHLLGGEMTYRYLDANGPAAAPLRYEITVAVYNNCGTSNVLRTAAAVGIYDQATGNQVVLTSVNYPSTTTAIAMQTGMMNITAPSSTGCISPANPPGCTITGGSQPYNLQKFVGVVNLPASSAGYYALFTDGTRNADVSNLDTPNAYTLMLYVTMAPPQRPNSSPVFSNEAVAIICTGDTTTLLNNAVDADGDRLVYAFGQPYGEVSGIGVLPTGNGAFVPPPSLVPYVGGVGYAPTTPFGTAPGNFALLNSATGIAKYGATTAGQKYVVAIDVQEYRNIGGQEVLIGTTRRDLQLVIASCPPTLAPVVPPPAVLPRNYTIEVGSTLTVPITATQASNPLTLTLNSVLLDGSGPYNAALNGNQGTVTAGNPTGTASVSGTNGTVTGTFVYVAGCGAARATPYDVAFVVKDNGCAGKTVADVIHITVTKPAGPNAISGPALVCDAPSPASYTASGGASPGISWRISGGGSIVGSATTNPVQVQWTTAGTYTLVARGVSQYGCFTDSVSKTVQVAPPLLVSGTQTICQGSSTTLTVTGGTSYTVTGGATTLTGAGPFTVSPAQTTTYTVTGSTALGCTPSKQVTITVLPLPLATVGPPLTVCSGVPFTLGAAPVAGNTYSWFIGGVVVASVANPTFTVNNTSGVPITYTYQLTEANAANCQTNNSVTVIINPAPAVAPGSDITFCSGNTGQLGAPPVAGLTYSWSPTTGLSNPTIANPTVTLTNATGAATSQTYTLTVASPNLPCPNRGTVTVTVSPVVLPGSIGTDQQVCPVLPATPLTELTPASGGTGTYTYQWESSPDGTTWAPIAGATSATYAPGVVTAATYYRRRVASADCTTAVSNVVQFTLLPLLVSSVALPAVPAQCAGTPMTFTALPTNAGPAPTYRWFVNGTLVASTTGPTFTSSTLADGDLLTVEQTVTAGFCATGPTTAGTTAHLIPVPLPAVTMSAKTTMPVCEGTPISFSLDVATNPSATPLYQWLVDGKAIAGATTPVFTTTALHEGQLVTLQLTAATVCGPRVATSAAVEAHVDPTVDVDAGPDQDLMVGDEVRLQATANGSYPLLWAPALGLSNPYVLQPLASPPVGTTVYTLFATRGQCSDASSVTVVVHPHLRIPSAFSPNGDGDDDTWEIDNIGEYVNNHVTIFNRWGSKLFETTNYGRGNEWSGTIGGTPAPIGTYYYIITVKNHSYTGPLTVIY